MKHIDEIYKDWSGEHHAINCNRPVHDSAECCDFAEYYHKIKKEQDKDFNLTNKELKLLIQILNYAVDEFLDEQQISEYLQTMEILNKINQL